MKKKDQTTEAIHLQHGEKHIVGVKSLRVLLSKDVDGAWFAQGLEIDYAAAGNSIEEVKKNFENGLMATIAEHLKLCGTIKKLLKTAQQSVWDEFYDTDPSSFKQKVSTMQLCDLTTKTKEISEPEKMFPFGGIEFIEPLLAA